MITRDQLRLQIDRLADTYGDKAFSAQREELIWEVVDGLEYGQVITIVDEFIKNSRQAPLPGEFAKAAQGLGKRMRYALGEPKPYDEANCKDCLDSGFIRLERRDQYESWAKYFSGSAPCHCRRGADLIAAGQRRKNPINFGPQFSPTWLNSYRVIETPHIRLVPNSDSEGA